MSRVHSCELAHEFIHAYVHARECTVRIIEIHRLFNYEEYRFRQGKQKIFFKPINVWKILHLLFFQFSRNIIPQKEFFTCIKFQSSYTYDDFYKVM